MRRLNQQLQTQISERGRASSETHYNRLSTSRANRSRTARASIDQQYGSAYDMQNYIEKHLGTSNMDIALKKINEGGIVLSFTDYDEERHYLAEQRIQQVYDEIVKEHQKHISRMLPEKEGLTKAQSVRFYSKLRFDEFMDVVKTYISAELDINFEVSYRKFAIEVSKKVGIPIVDSDFYRYPGPKIDFVERVINRIHDDKEKITKRTSLKKGGKTEGTRKTKGTRQTKGTRRTKK
jgi:hypothetical protein